MHLTYFLSLIFDRKYGGLTIDLIVFEAGKSQFTQKVQLLKFSNFSWILPAYARLFVPSFRNVSVIVSLKFKIYVHRGFSP